MYREPLKGYLRSELNHLYLEIVSPRRQIHLPLLPVQIFSAEQLNQGIAFLQPLNNHQ